MLAMRNLKRKLHFADLTHTVQGITAPTFPLGASFVVAYAMKELGTEDFEYRLFKFPSTLDQAIQSERPDILCFSSYSWNFELAYKIASLAKQHLPGIVVVFGGPNFPVEAEEKLAVLKTRRAIDFFVELEGEIGFVELVKKLEDCNFDTSLLRSRGERLRNTSYVSGDRLITGTISRIDDINVIPSPYLMGILDPFFEHPLVPMVETTRGCPFTCTFCADGIPLKSKVRRFEDGRTREEIYYIADRVKKTDELIVTDLNFGMYKEDATTCKYIAEVQEKYKWPVLVQGSAGKNKTERVIEAASILKGTWIVGAAIQSTDAEVLKAIKRSNISSETFEKFVEFGNGLAEDALTYTEIILGMPRDTREKHFESLRFGVKNNVNSIRMYQTVLLLGTEMASQDCRKEYGLVTKFRTIPGSVGNYRLFGEEQRVGEIEEIIVASNAMSFDDYIDCRIMNLFVETLYNNAIFQEVFNMLRIMDVPVFDCLLFVKNHSELYPDSVRRIIDEFVFQTSKDLHESREEAERSINTAQIQRYIGGELGINELLVHMALLYMQFDDLSRLLFDAVKGCLKEKNLFGDEVEDYLNQLQRYIGYRKKDITNYEQVFVGRFTYDFNEVEQRQYKIDPRQFPRISTREVTYKFFHDEEQKKHISRQLDFYAATPVGLGRFIQRSNLRKMFRRIHPQAA